MKLKYILSGICLLMASTYIKAQGPAEVTWVKMDEVTVPIPPKVHPRLYLRSTDIPELRERVKHPEIKKTLAKIKALGKDRTPEEEAKAPAKDGFRYYAEMRGVVSRVQLKALDYLLHGNKKVAREAITQMLDTLQRTNYGIKGDLSRASGQMLMNGALVYDWCYDQMKEQEKQDYIKHFIRIAKTMECGYPPKNTEPIAGHTSEWMVLRDMLSASIAIYDEHPDMYNYIIQMLYEDYIPARNFIYSGHNYHQGTGYVNVRFSNDMFSQWILSRMGAGPIYDPSQQFVLYDFLYRRRPDGFVFPAGDFTANAKQPSSYGLPSLLAYSYYNDPYLAYEYQRKPKIDNHCLIFDVLWKDINVTPKAPDDLPLTRYSGSPFGWMIARTSWDDNCAMAEMKINEQHVGNHQHMDGGSFQLYYKGPLGIDAGSYKGTSGGYNSPHNKNFFKRTIAHNSLLIYDPNEKFASWNYGGSDKSEYVDNDGGQRLPGDRWNTCRSFADLMSPEYTVGKVLAHGMEAGTMAPDYSYLKGDITQAYSKKVNDVKRSFVFLNLKDEKIPAAFIVFDKVVSSDTSFKKYWLMHCIEEPEVKDGAFVISRTYKDYNGKVESTVLLPHTDNLDITKIGGKGKDFWVFGKNYANDPTPRVIKETDERGAWRIELSPKIAQKEDYFLNVMQLTDNDNHNLHKVTAIEGHHLIGVNIADRIVTFSSNSELINGQCAFTLEGEATKKVVMTDMKPGTWQVIKDGKLFISAIEVAADDCILSFEATAGNYEFRR